MSALSDPLTGALTQQIRTTFVHELWSATSFEYPSANSEDWDAFFAFYQYEWSRSVLRDGGRPFWPKTYEKLLKCAKALSFHMPGCDVEYGIKETMPGRKDLRNYFWHSSIIGNARLYL